MHPARQRRHIVNTGCGGCHRRRWEGNYRLGMQDLVELSFVFIDIFHKQSSE